MAIILERKPPKLIQRIYFWDILKSMAVTAKIYWQQRWARLKNASETICGPVQRIMRNQHRLVLKNDGTPLCDHCGICAQACPSQSITLSPLPLGERADTVARCGERGKISEFKIDLSRCLFCGTCMDTCPINAIKMDGKKTTLATQRKKDLVVTLS